MSAGKRMVWKVQTASLLGQVLDNPGTAILQKPLIIFGALLEQVATRAAELNDPELNKLMLQLALYEKGDPTSPEYDEAIMRKYGL